MTPVIDASAEEETLLNKQHVPAYNGTRLIQPYVLRTYLENIPVRDRLAKRSRPFRWRNPRTRVSKQRATFPFYKVINVVGLIGD